MRRVPTALCIAGALLGGLVLVWNALASGLACYGDSNSCAIANKPRLWQGRVYDHGQRAAHVSVQYLFYSSKPRGPNPIPGTRVNTDALGRYCLRWPAERSIAEVGVAPQGSAISGSAPAGARTPLTQLLIVTPDAGGWVVRDPRFPGQLARAPWNPATDATFACVSKSPPWYNRDDVKTNWRVRLLTILGLLTLVASAAAFLARKTKYGHDAGLVAGGLGDLRLCALRLNLAHAHCVASGARSPSRGEVVGLQGRGQWWATPGESAERLSLCAHSFGRRSLRPRDPGLTRPRRVALSPALAVKPGPIATPFSLGWCLSACQPSSSPKDISA